MINVPAKWVPDGSFGKFRPLLHLVSLSPFVSHRGIFIKTNLSLAVFLNTVPYKPTFLSLKTIVSLTEGVLPKNPRLHGRGLITALEGQIYRPKPAALRQRKVVAVMRDPSSQWMCRFHQYTAQMPSSSAQQKQGNTRPQRPDRVPLQSIRSSSLMPVSGQI